VLYGDAEAELKLRAQLVDEGADGGVDRTDWRSVADDHA